MSYKIKKQTLTKALLQKGKMEFKLYQFELEELIGEFTQSLIDDRDEFMFAVTEHSGDVAMVLIESPKTVHINEEARDRLMVIFGKAYNGNVKNLIPHFVNELNNERIPVQGIKTTNTKQLH
jgi:hypothetical protein